VPSAEEVRRVFDNLSTGDISAAIDELVGCLGVKEDRSRWDLLTLLGNKNTQACVQEIATQLGLPIQITLAYVPNDLGPADTRGFRSNSLSRTDWTGHGVDGITAQVCIPSSLPLFGSSALSGYSITVRVSENCFEHGATFIAVMAHELSHVLLRSLYHPQQDSELHTDLVPILLGFGECVREGRRNIHHSTEGGRTTTRTTTYGYLTDEQFEFACKKTAEILQRHTADKTRLVALIKDAQLKLRKAKANLGAFRDYLAYLDRNLTTKIKEQDAHRIVQFHTWNYTSDWEKAIANTELELDSICIFVRTLNHYTSSTVERLREHKIGLDRASETLDQVMKAIAVDLRVVRSNAGLIFRLRRAIRRFNPKTD
jgi:hypothetical protein